MMKNKTNNLIFGIFLLVIIFCFQIKQVTAQTEINESQATEQLQFLEKTINSEKEHTQLWWYSWLGLYSSATIVQGAIYFTSTNTSTRQDMALGAVTTILGAAGQFISPLIPNKTTEQFNLLPEKSKDEQLKKIAKADELLHDLINREIISRNWQNHALSTSVNLGTGLITWLGFKRTFKDGLVNFVLNEAVTEVQIWTSPTFAKRNYKIYCQKYINQDNTVSYIPEANWYFEAYPGGLGIRVVF